MTLIKNNKKSVLKLLEAIEQLDITSVEKLLANSPTLNKSHNLFLQKLNISFNDFKKAKDTRLISYKGKCGSCDKRRSGYLFVGNKSNNYLALIISYKNNSFEIFKCSSFNCFEQGLNLKDSFFDVDNPF